MATPHTHATIDIDGLAVFYETEGDGDAIVLLHGGMADNSTWSAQFSGLSPHRRVVAPERQAQGHTPDRPGPLTYQAMADQTVTFLNALKLAPVDLLGWSDGGMVGTLIAAEHPELVRTLIVTGSGFSSAGLCPSTNTMTAPTKAQAARNNIPANSLPVESFSQPNTCGPK